MDIAAHTRLSEARAAIASACLDSLPAARLGSVVLRDDQRLLVARARRMIDRDGGCLIADDVGRGKTFVALALGGAWLRRLVIIPPTLRNAWDVAMERTGLACAVTTHHALSAGRLPSRSSYDVIIVDESHHFRTSTTRRYRALSELVMEAPMILLSATPVQNRLRDLAAQVALFIGAAAFEMTPAQLTRFVLRGDDAPLDRMPTAALPQWISIDAHDEEVLHAIINLPDPVRPRDAGDEGALRTIALLRAWASSRAALRASVRRRRRIAIALEQGLAEGLLPTQNETKSWLAIDDAVQLGFAPLLIGGSQEARGDDLLRRLEDERTALDALSQLLRAQPDPDEARVSALRSLRRASGGRRILIFSEFASTVAAMYDALRTEPNVAMLTSHAANIASGRIARDELLKRFAPVAQAGGSFLPHEQVTFLLTTDLLSEGLDLQDASVVVHLDLPWNPARLEQRLGRVRRPGGTGSIESYLFAPPASAAALLALEHRLRHKASLAEAVTGAAWSALPVLSRDQLETLQLGPTPAATERGQVMSTLARWKYEGGASPCENILTASVQAEAHGWLACLEDGTLIGSVFLSIHNAVLACEGIPRALDVGAANSALRELDTWIQRERIQRVAGSTSPTGSLREAALAQLGLIVSTIPRVDRANILPLLSQLRERLGHSMPLAIERCVLDTLRCVTEGKHTLHTSMRSLLDITNRSDTRTYTSCRPVAVVVFGNDGKMHEGASRVADPFVLRW